MMYYTLLFGGCQEKNDKKTKKMHPHEEGAAKDPMQLHIPGWESRELMAQGGYCSQVEGAKLEI